MHRLLFLDLRPFSREHSSARGLLFLPFFTDSCLDTSRSLFLSSLPLSTAFLVCTRRLASSVGVIHRNVSFLVPPPVNLFCWRRLQATETRLPLLSVLFDKQCPLKQASPFFLRLEKSDLSPYLSTIQSSASLFFQIRELHI